MHSVRFLERLLDKTRSRKTRDGIRIYEQADFAGMHVAGALAARILDDVAQHVFPGQTTEAIDRLITHMVEEAGATSATIGYKGPRCTTSAPAR